MAKNNNNKQNQENEFASNREEFGEEINFNRHRNREEFAEEANFDRNRNQNNNNREKR